MIKLKTWILVVTAVLVSCNNAPTHPQLTIAVASNMHGAMEEIARLFTQQTGIDIQMSSGSSGVLSAQIKQGAPFDVFLSANMTYPKALHKEGLTDGGPTTYAHGVLILWCIDGTDINQGLQSLIAESVNNFAIANPETAPYGIAAAQALQRSGLMSQLEPKMVIGESVGQVNQYISSGTVQVGLTSSSVLKSTDLKGSSHEVAEELYDPIEQGIVVLKTGLENNPIASKLFYEFMFSPEAQRVLTDFGYQPLGVRE